MKIIEALKKVKMNRSKISDLQNLIRNNAAHMESGIKSLAYPDPAKKIKEWEQSIHDIQKENAKLLASVQLTNLSTNVTVEIGSNQVTKTISEWIYRRREGVDFDIATQHAKATSLKQVAIKGENGEIQVDNVIRNYDQGKRDEILMQLSQEKMLIDSQLEIINAVTDLKEIS